MFNATFNNISVTTWQYILVMGEMRVPWIRSDHCLQIVFFLVMNSCNDSCTGKYRSISIHDPSIYVTPCIHLEFPRVENKSSINYTTRPLLLTLLFVFFLIFFFRFIFSLAFLLHICWCYNDLYIYQ